MILFQPKQVYPMNDDVLLEGILDRLKFWEAIKVYENVTVGDLMKVLNAMKSKDVASIRAAVETVANNAGFAMEADEIDDIVAELIQRDVKGIIYETCDATMKFLVKYGGYVPESDVKLMAEPEEILDVRTMTRENSLEWLGRRRQQVKDGVNLRVVKRIINKRSPELYQMLAGEMTPEACAALSPEQIKKIVDVMRVVSKILTYGSILAGPYAPLVMILAQAINLLIARYDSLHPTGGEVADADKGLDFSDFVG